MGEALLVGVWLEVDKGRNLTALLCKLGCCFYPT